MVPGFLYISQERDSLGASATSLSADPIYTGVEAHNRIVVSERPKLYRLYCNGLNDTATALGVPGLTRWETSTLELVTLEKYEIDLTLPGFHRSPPLFVD